MIAERQFIGIDVSKARLDIFIHPLGEMLSVANTPEGFKTLMLRLQALCIAAIAVEASGGYEQAIAKAAVQAGYTLYLLDPAQVRSFAKAMKTKAKTDAMDAVMIARYTAAAQDVLVPFVHEPIRVELAELTAYRRSLIAESNSLKSSLDTTSQTTVRHMMAKRLATIKTEIKTLDHEIRHLIATVPKLVQTSKTLLSLPGVGPVLTATLIADLPELGQIGAKRIASLVGVAPHARQSGKIDKGGKCSGGRKSIRDVLYMATLSAIKAKMPHLYPFYERLRSAGKPFKPALIACMRKFLTIINAIIRDGSTFRSKPI